MLAVCTLTAAPWPAVPHRPHPFTGTLATVCGSAAQAGRSAVHVLLPSVARTARWPARLGGLQPAHPVSPVCGHPSSRGLAQAPHLAEGKASKTVKGVCSLESRVRAGTHFLCHARGQQKEPTSPDSRGGEGLPLLTTWAGDQGGGNTAEPPRAWRTSLKGPGSGDGRRPVAAAGPAFGSVSSAVHTATPSSSNTCSSLPLTLLCIESASVF